MQPFGFADAFLIMKVLYLDLCLKIGYTFLIDCNLTCLRGFRPILAITLAD